jgi:phospholipase A1
LHHQLLDYKQRANPLLRSFALPLQSLAAPGAFMATSFTTRFAQLAAYATGSALMIGLGAPVPAHAQAAETPTASWQSCAALADGPARLNCFDLWARRQQQEPGVVAPPGVVPPPAPAAVVAPVAPAQVAGAQNGCHDGRYSNLSRFWELERATDCGTFELRGYRPISLDLVGSDTVNRQPTSPAPGRSATTAEDYRTTETRIQLSARVKVAKGLLTRGDPTRSDSLWVGFSQQSYWQFFTGQLSRPFRTTDYEPEAMYVYPTDWTLPGGWRMRYAGAGLSHQSNGRQLPLSRSWNRAYLMTGLELDNRFSLEGRIWKRVFENDNDDNPDITDFMGRGELTGTWHMDKVNTVAATLRHTLRSAGHGSLRLEYFRALGKGTRVGNLNDLRFHAQFFSGYGDSMLDYNRRRNVLSLGLALVDW